MNVPPPIRIAIVSDDRLSADGLVRFLLEQSDFAVRACEPAAEGSLTCLAGAYDILLLEARVRDRSTRGAPLPDRGAVILVGAPDDDEWAAGALSAGARGILTHTAGLDDVVAAIRVVHGGGIWARRRWLNACVLRVVGQSKRRVEVRDVLAARLSPREREVLRLAASGLCNKELAGRLSISSATVKVHLTRIFQKLGVGSRAALAAAYHGVASADGALVHPGRTTDGVRLASHRPSAK